MPEEKKYLPFKEQVKNLAYNLGQLLLIGVLIALGWFAFAYFMATHGPR